MNGRYPGLRGDAGLIKANCSVNSISYWNIDNEDISYFGGARSKGFATLRNVSKLQFFDKIGHAKSVGFRYYSTI